MPKKLDNLKCSAAEVRIALEENVSRNRDGILFLTRNSLSTLINAPPPLT